MKKDEFIFSPELRARLAKFGQMDVGDALKSPEFFNALLDHAGMDQSEKNALWEKVGRPDLKDQDA